MCSELPGQSVPEKKSSSEVGCNVLNYNVDISNMLVDGCEYFSTNGESGSASCIDRKISSIARMSECENFDTLLGEKALDDDMQTCFSTFCGKFEVCSPVSGGYCTIPYEQKVEDSVDKKSILDTCVQVSSPGCQRTLGSSTMACSSSEATQLEQGINKSEIGSYADVTKALEQRVDFINETKDDTVKVDCVTESKFPDIVLLPSQRSSRQSKPACKPNTKRSPRKCNNQTNADQPGCGTKTIKEATRKKRSFSSKRARSSVWGLLGNDRQFFEQDSGFQVNKVICEGSGKARASFQSAKTDKHDANSSTWSSKQNCGASTNPLRLKIKLAKGFSLSYPNIVVPEIVDGSSSTSYLESGLGSQKLAHNAGDKLSEQMAVGKFKSHKNNLDKDVFVRNGQIANNHLESSTLMKLDGDAEEICLMVPSKKLVDALIEPISINGVDSGNGTSPDSEVIDSIPEVQVGERHHDSLNDTDLGSYKEFNFSVYETDCKRGKKKDKQTYSSNHSIKDGSWGKKRKNKAKSSKNHGCKKDFTDVVSSTESPISDDINTLGNSVTFSDSHAATQPLCPFGEIGLGDTTDALKVKSHVEVKEHCSLDVDNGYSESPVFENFLSPKRSLGHKLPKSLESSKISETKSRTSELKRRKKIASRCEEKPKRPINKSEVKGNGVSHKVTPEVEDLQHIENGIDGEHKLDSFGKIDTVDNKISVNISNLDAVPHVGLWEPHLSPRKAWVRCDDCHKWRRIRAALADQIEETNCAWTCMDNNDKAFADCSIPQEKSNAEINAELGLSDASGEEDAYEGRRNYKELEHQRPMFRQDSTFTHIYTNEFLHRGCKTQTIDEIMVCHCKPPTKGRLGCGDECLNRMLNIECVQGACPCGDLCSNQQFQKRNYARLKWFKCGKKGYGLKALECISKGQFLIEYVGEVLDVHAYEARQIEYALKGHRHFYFMTLNGSEVIDASAKGNLGRFINHSCDPNCRTEKWMVNGEICIGLFALKDIKQDEELTFDYNYVRVFGAAAKKCHCGSSQCRGYIGSDPNNAESIVQCDSDEEFPEPVMLNEDGEVEDGISRPSHCDDNVDTQTTGHVLKDRNLSNHSTTAIGLNGSSEKDSPLNPASAISQLNSSLEVEDSKGNLLSSVQVEELSQQMEDVTSKPMPSLEQGYAVESELSDKTSFIRKLKTSFTSSVGKSKSKIIEDRSGLSESHLLVRTSRVKGSVKKGKVCASHPNYLKAEVTTNRLQVSSIKCKKVVEGSSGGHFEAVEEKLKELLDPEGGISRSKDATKGYLKLLLLTVASGNRSNGEVIQSCSNRDLSMILGALLETRSRAVLNDIINKNGLRMLHNIMKQYRRDFKRTPILRKLLKVLERLAERKILTYEHINGGPPCHGMESFRQSMLSLTEHEDKEVHQIARSFRDKWIPRFRRKHGCKDRDDRREPYRNFNCNRFSVSPNHRREQDLRPTDTIDCVQQPMAVMSSVSSGAQEGCSAPYVNGSEINGGKRRKRKSRWDQPAETNIDIASNEQKEGKVVSRLSCQTDATNSVDGMQNISEDVPPGFSCLVQPHLGSLNATLNSGDLASQNSGNSSSGCPSIVVTGHPKEKFNSSLPVSFGMPWPVVQQFGTIHGGTADSWVTAPGMPFKPFPPLPSYPQNKSNGKPWNITNAVKIDQPTEVVQWDSAHAEDLSHEDSDRPLKRLKDSPNDLGRTCFRQQKWNKSKIPRPWSTRNQWGCNGNEDSRVGLSSVGVNVPEDAIYREGKDDNNS